MLTRFADCFVYVLAVALLATLVVHEPHMVSRLAATSDRLADLAAKSRYLTAELGRTQSQVQLELRAEYQAALNEVQAGRQPQP